MADNAEVFTGITKETDVSYTVLVPNLIGLENAIKVGVKDIAIFGSASESFSKKNTNCTIQQSMKQLTAVADQAIKTKIKIRGYISCCMGCPYEGEVKPSVVSHVAALMLNLGCYEISLGDTIGVATPLKIRRVLHEIKNLSGDLAEFALHCHDTYGQAVANIYTGLEYGIRIFDSSVAGLGGCPYATGATGNVATEDLLYLLHGQGMETGIDVDKVVDIGDFISKILYKKNQSKSGVAMLARKKLKKH
ncbi:hypothetical protein KM043_003222 [Ampulex compressa]|nr:hypothetical protein KM043_003222 [Ampulex compressa]